MIRINKIWWEHLAPAEIQPLRGEVQRLITARLNEPYYEHWARCATRAGGVMKLRPGQAIPTVHAVFIDGHAPFVGPQRKLKDGHRTVHPKMELHDGPIADDELIIKPEITVEVVRDAVFLEALRHGKETLMEKNIKFPSVLFTCPATFLFFPQKYPKKSFVLYQHIFGSGTSYPNDGYFYVGVTTRSWQRRWSEHRRAMQTNSPLLFHKRFREEQLAGRLSYVHHRVMGVTDDIEALYNTEEFLVEGHWHDERRLNMVPGGKSGLRYMRENGMLPERSVPLPDERDRILTKWLHDHPRKGLPAPWVAEKWRDNAWAVAQICGRDDRLSVDQVRAIRALAQTHSVTEIAARIGARNEAQVNRVITGKTYTRVE